MSSEPRATSESPPVVLRLLAVRLGQIADGKLPFDDYAKARLKEAADVLLASSVPSEKRVARFGCPKGCIFNDECEHQSDCKNLGVAAPFKPALEAMCPSAQSAERVWTCHRHGEEVTMKSKCDRCDCLQGMPSSVRSSEAVKMRAILDRCHHAIGESEHSDDDTLPDSIEQIIHEHRQRVKELEGRTAPADVFKAWMLYDAEGTYEGKLHRTRASAESDMRDNAYLIDAKWRIIRVVVRPTSTTR